MLLQYDNIYIENDVCQPLSTVHQKVTGNGFHRTVFTMDIVQLFKASDFSAHLS